MQKVGTGDASPTYAVNHGVGKRWPFSIYHGPINDYVQAAAAAAPHEGVCLNLGCAHFDNYPAVKGQRRWYACDADPRCVAEVRRRYPEIIAETCESQPDYTAETFDFIVSTEVIEHICDPPAWLATINRILKPGGRAVLTTPNYGFSLLPLVEYSFLEVVARRNGFTRFGIHPNKYTAGKLRRQMRQAFGDGADISILKRSLGMVLVADVTKPMGPSDAAGS